MLTQQTKMTRQEEIVFNLDLRCVSNSKENPCARVITFNPSYPPKTVEEIISKLEETLEIPGAAMTLEKDSAVLKKEDELDQLRLQSNDTITVKYYSVASCSEVNNCLESMNTLLDKLKKWKEVSFEGSMHITTSEMHFNEYSIDLFARWTDPHNYANKVHFLSKQGLQLIKGLMELISDIPFIKTSIQLQFIELGLLSCLVNIAEDGLIRRLMIASGAIDSCVNTLLRYPIAAAGRSSYGSEHTYEISRALILESLGVLANLCEIPAASLDICSRDNVIEQMYSIILSPDFDPGTVHRVFMTLIDLSYCTQNHSRLVQQDMFCKIIGDLWITSRGISSRQPLIRYNKAVLASILVLMSPDLFTTNSKHSNMAVDDPNMATDDSRDHRSEVVTETLDKFINEADYKDLSQHEQSLGIYWGTIIPVVEVLYTSRCTSELLQTDLRDLSRRVMVLTLKSLLLREYHREIMVREGMTDYIVCIPWYPHNQDNEDIGAKELVELIRQSPDVPYQPPSLLNMCKAAVAVYHCGLHDVMRLSVPELANKLWS